MTRVLYFRLLFIIMSLMLYSAKGQSDHFAYAITSVNKGGSVWVALRKLDTRTGEFSSILFNVEDSSVAAIAYDRKFNRLYFTPMNIDQLHYIDLSKMETFAIPDQYFSKAGKYDLKNTGPINRMVIAPDEFGYTITNDGNHLIRFTTSGSPVITDMGDLIDDPQNKEMTIHSICANSGGDMVADDNGHLYLITGSNKVFKVDIATKMTSYLGTITGLPQKFTTSGVAVAENGKQLIVTSTVYTEAYFVIDPESLNASPSQTKYIIFESSDLANSNVLSTNTPVNSNMFISKSGGNLYKIKIYPNPVMEDIVSIQFNELQAGSYTIQLADVVGRIVLQQNAKITGNTQTEIMHIPTYATQGFYYIRILDEKNNEVGTQKLVVERW